MLKYIVEVGPVKLEGDRTLYTVTNNGDGENLIVTESFQEADDIFRSRKRAYSELDKDYSINLISGEWNEDSEEFEDTETLDSYNYFEYLGDLYDQIGAQDIEDIKWDYEKSQIGSAKYVIAEEILKEYFGDHFEEAVNVIMRSKYYNMREICQEAGVSYESWRKYKCGAQKMALEKIEAIDKTMDRI